jgi:hypothetical protein
MSLSIEVAAGTDVGCVRDNNKDNSGYDRRHTRYRFGGNGWTGYRGDRQPDRCLHYAGAFCRPRKSGNFPGSGEALEVISEGANARGVRNSNCESRDPLVLSSARGSRSYSPVQGPTG